MPYKAGEPRGHKVFRARHQVINWPDNKRALQQRGSLTVWVTLEALAAAWHPLHTGGGGGPRDHSEVAIETGHLLRLAFGRPLLNTSPTRPWWWLSRHARPRCQAWLRARHPASATETFG